MSRSSDRLEPGDQETNERRRCRYQPKQNSKGRGPETDQLESRSGKDVDARRTDKRRQHDGEAVIILDVVDDIPIKIFLPGDRVS